MLAFRKESLSDWNYVIRRNLAAGKSVQVYGKAEEVDDLVKNVSARGLLVTVDTTEEQAQKLMDRYSEL